MYPTDFCDCCPPDAAAITESAEASTSKEIVAVIGEAHVPGEK